MHIGKRIRYIRQQREMSQRELGEALGKCQPHVYQWEHGISRMFFDDVVACANVFGISVETLMTFPMLDDSQSQNVAEDEKNEQLAHTS